MTVHVLYVIGHVLVQYVIGYTHVCASTVLYYAL